MEWECDLEKLAVPVVGNTNSLLERYKIERFFYLFNLSDLSVSARKHFSRRAAENK